MGSSAQGILRSGPRQAPHEIFHAARVGLFKRIPGAVENLVKAVSRVLRRLDVLSADNQIQSPRDVAACERVLPNREGQLSGLVQVVQYGFDVLVASNEPELVGWACTGVWQLDLDRVPWSFQDGLPIPLQSAQIEQGRRCRISLGKPGERNFSVLRNEPITFCDLPEGLDAGREEVVAAAGRDEARQTDDGCCRARFDETISYTTVMISGQGTSSQPGLAQKLAAIDPI